MSNNNIGIDMVKVARIQKIYDKYGNKFLEKVFNNTEISYIKNKKFKTETIAGMFSFKESISKSLGTGFGEKLKFKDINISHDKLGKPMGKVGDKNFLLSASHDGDYVVTFAMANNETIEISESIRKLYIPRRDDFHKGDYGKTMIIASSEGMIGSGFLASKAALKAGCGVTYHYVFEEDNIFQSLSIKHTEVILKKDNPIISLEKMNSVLFGCGLGISRKKREVLTELLNSDINLVIDADGINMLAEDTSRLFTKKAKLVLTPHILEFSRLIKEVIPPGKKLYSYAKDFAKVNNLVLVLKDSKTMITDGERVEFIERENSGMATPGSGDVLAGIITSLISQGYSCFDGAFLGAQIHSLAGLVAANKKSKASMIASDIIDGMDSVFKELEER